MKEQPNEVDIEKLKELEAKATPGPWTIEMKKPAIISQLAADLDLTIALRNTFPAIATELTALRAELIAKQTVPSEDKTCGELSCEECNERYARVMAELAASRERERVMRELLKERAFYCEKGEMYDRGGYSLDVEECMAIRDINYRNAPLYATVDEAIDAALLSASTLSQSRESLADQYIKASGKEVHSSDCSTSIAPAEHPGPCDCSEPSAMVREELDTIDEISDALPEAYTAHKRPDITGVYLLDDVKDLARDFIKVKKSEAVLFQALRCTHNSLLAAKHSLPDGVAKQMAEIATQESGQALSAPVAAGDGWQAFQDRIKALESDLRNAGYDCHADFVKQADFPSVSAARKDGGEAV